MSDAYHFSGRDVKRIGKSVRRTEGGHTSQKPIPRRRGMGGGGTPSGVGIVTQEITAAFYSEVNKKLKYGKGTIRPFKNIEVVNPGDEDNDILDDDPESPFLIYTSVEESTPVGKIVHWTTRNGRKTLVVEPCAVSDQNAGEP